ncbi:MAG TPA: MFS transporter [Actinomycetales bacterium]
MTTAVEPSRRTRPHWHRAWAVAAVTFAALVCAAAFRSATGVLMEPVEAEFGWSRTTTSSAVTVNLVLFGLTAPFAAAVMERFGLRRVVAGALVLVALGTGLTVVMTAAWQLLVLWGVAVGLGTGSMALVFGAVVANRWFVTRRGLVMGVFSAASATGQLAFLPLVARVVQDSGWRPASLAIAGTALLLVPAVLLWLADSPAAAGVEPYGAPASPPRSPSPSPSPSLEKLRCTGGVPVAPPLAATPVAAGVVPLGSPGRVALSSLAEASRSWTFRVLAGTFFVCGWSTNGLIQTHFVPAAHDHGMPTTTAAGLLALVGLFDIVGTLASGWLTDRVDPRLLLLAYYGLRGLSLLVVPSVLGPAVAPPLFLFVVFYGLDWVATVPPTVALCRTHFGVERSAVVFGWVFAAHMVGAGVAASYAGVVRQTRGEYDLAWYTAGVLCLVAAVAVLAIRREPERTAGPSLPALRPGRRCPTAQAARPTCR